MVELRQNANGSFSARKRLPDDVREEYGRLYRARFEAKFSAPATAGLAGAKQQFREWEAEVARRIEAIRATRRGDGIDLSREQAAALSGEWYRWFVARHEGDSGKPDAWEAALWSLIDAMLAHAPEEVRAAPMRGLEWSRDPDVRAGIRPVIQDKACTAQFLASRGIALTNAALALFLDFVVDDCIAALGLLERRSRNDYSADEHEAKFPKLSLDPPTESLTPWALFEAWVKAKAPAQSTIESWRTVFNALTADFPDRNAGTVTTEEAQRWSDKLVTKERSAFTVHNTWMRAAKTIYAWGVRRKLLAANPFAAVVVDVPRGKKHRPKSFYVEEQTTILRATLGITDTQHPDIAARRWVPWLLAYTGARPQDITQLRGTDVQQVDGVWTLNLTPEAGTIKGGQARRVPLHDHLIEQGFLGFVQSRGEGPLFYRPRKRKANGADPVKQRKSPAAQGRQRLAAWVRELGVTDEHVSPNHAWRHTFKQIGRREGLGDTILDHICGHAPATEGRKYGEPTLRDVAQVIQRFPRYEV